MPDFDKVLFEGEFDPSEIRKGIDDMIDTFKKAQAQGDLSNVTLAKMQGAIDGVTEAATNLQAATGKTSIAGALGDGALVPKISAIRDKVAEVSKTITSSVDKAKSKLAELQKSQTDYKNGVKDLTSSLKLNEKEQTALYAQLQKVNTATKDGKKEAAALRAEIASLANAEKTLTTNLATAKTELANTNTAIKLHTKELQTAEAATSKFGSGIRDVFGGLRKIAYLIPGLGLAGLIGIITGPVIGAFEKWYEKIFKVNSEAEKQKKILGEVFADAGNSSGADIAHMEILRSVITNLNEPLAKRINAVRAYNELASAGNAIDEKQIDNLNKINSAIDREIEQIGKRALAQAFENRLGEASNALVKLELELKSKKALNQGLTTAGYDPNNPIQALERQQALQREVAAENPNLVKSIADAKKDFQDILNFSHDYLDFADFIKTKPDKIKKAKKEIENIYQQELQSLKADIAKLDEKGFTDEASITKGIEEDFKKRSLAFDKAFKDKKLTAGQLGSLKGYLSNLQDLTLNQQLKSFREQRAAYLTAINDELTSVQAEESTKRIASLQDNFERERQTIIAETDKTILALGQKRDKQIADITKNASKNGLTAADVQPQIDKIKEAYGKLIDDLGIIKNQKLQQLSFDTFQKLTDELQKRFNSKDQDISALSIIDIKKQTDLFLQGEISYGQYQKNLTKIAKDESDKRYQNDREGLRAQITANSEQLFLNNDNLTEDERTKLLDKIRSLEAQLDQLDKNHSLGDASALKQKHDQQIESIVKYTQAIGGLVDSVIGFWQKANEAEQAALEKSIAIQDRRVDAARNIAAKGNAEYLRLEEERQQALLIKQENAARRTLAINAALQASQVIVALVSSIAEGAKVGGALGAIIDVAAVVGAIASAYAIAQSFKPVTPSFFVGTEDTGTGGQADSKGGFNALLHPHERVLTAEQNKNLKGISNDELIRTMENHKLLVQNWATPRIPELNIAAMDSANNLMATEQVKLASIMEENNQKLEENNELQRKSIKILKAMGMSVSMDRHGFAASFMQSVEEMQRTKKS